MEIINYQLEPLQDKGFAANYKVSLRKKRKASLEEYMDSIRCSRVVVDECMTLQQITNLILDDASSRFN